MRVKTVLIYVGIALFAINASSCVNRKTNYIIEGLFTGSGDSTNFYLEIKQIDHESYSHSDGLNVVKDLTNKNSYLILIFTK